MRLTSGRVVLGAASAGSIALLVRTAVVGPVSPALMASALGLYAGVVVAGALIPRLEMYGDVLCSGPSGKRRVSLTFDDGPSAETTPRVLDALKAAGAFATFFVIGEKVERAPDVVRAIHEAGHEIGVHGHRHDRLYALKTPSDIQRDIERACSAVERITLQRPKWFRPPIGQVSPRVVLGARRANVRLVGWSARGFDGIGVLASARIARRIQRGLRDGAIVLLHDAAERDDRVPASIGVLPEILRAVDRAGLAPVRLSELASPVSP